MEETFQEIFNLYGIAIDIKQQLNKYIITIPLKEQNSFLQNTAEKLQCYSQYIPFKINYTNETVDFTIPINDNFLTTPTYIYEIFSLICQILIEPIEGINPHIATMLSQYLTNN